MGTEFIVKFKRQDAIVIFYLVDDEVTERKAMELLAKITGKTVVEQISIVQEYLTEYSQLFAIVCAGGLMKFLGRKIDRDESGLIRLSGEEITKLPKHRQRHKLGNVGEKEHPEQGEGGG